MARARKVYGLPLNPVPTSRSCASATMRRGSRSTRPRRSGRSSARRRPSRTRAIYLTAAFTGLRRGELIALRWRDVDFAAIVRVARQLRNGQLTTPKSGTVAAVPMVPEVAERARLARRRRYSTGDDDLVFAGRGGGYLDGSALRRRYKARAVACRAAPAALPRSAPHLRHSRDPNADIVEVQEWMGHADVQTTMRYTALPQHADAAARLSRAFQTAAPADASPAPRGAPGA